MKNLALVFMAAASLGFASCQKCTICTKDGEADERICEKDYDSNTEYGFAIDAREALGYNCND